VIYYAGSGVYLVDQGASSLGTVQAIALSLALLIGAWLVYDGLWSSPLGKRPALAATISFALLVGAAFGLTRVFPGRAAYIHFGAMLGTIMAANVWRRIIPAQNQMLAATRAGGVVDVSLGQRAKTRSIHNHYMTLPVLFTMLSNHFASTYGHPLNWLVLLLIAIFGAAAKYVMNFRASSNRWIAASGAAALIGVVTLTARAPRSAGAGMDFSGSPPVAFATARAIIDRRCITCHSAHPSNPSFPQPPNGIILEEPRRIHGLADRIMVRAVTTKTMPLANLTGMTEEERRTLGAWIAQGARTDESR